MKKVIIALPGREYSGTFLINWSQTLLLLIQKGYTVKIVNEYSSFVSFSRMKTLGLDVMRGADQKPFGGSYDYDVWLTIDSDIVFKPEQVIELIEDTDKHPVISGLYRMADLKHYAAVIDWDVEYFKKYGSFKFIGINELDRRRKYLKVAYNGMGFFACRREVLEKMKYPYFNYPLVEMEGEDGKIIRDMCSEDVAFCKNIINAGYDIIVNTRMRVGHEKTLVI
jgi:hypothetical protein